MPFCYHLLSLLHILQLLPEIWEGSSKWQHPSLSDPHSCSENIPCSVRQKSCRKTVYDHANIEYIKMQMPKKEKSHFSESAFRTVVILLEFCFSLVWAFPFCTRERSEWKCLRLLWKILGLFFSLPLSLLGWKGAANKEQLGFTS